MTDALALCIFISVARHDAMRVSADVLWQLYLQSFSTFVHEYLHEQQQHALLANIHSVTMAPPLSIPTNATQDLEINRNQEVGGQFMNKYSAVAFVWLASDGQTVVFTGDWPRTWTRTMSAPATFTTLLRLTSTDPCTEPCFVP